MNKQMKQHLEAVVEALVEQDTTAAKAAFHDYLRLKSQSILLGEAAEEESDDEGDKEPDGDKDDMKSDDKDDKKAPPFEKKDKKDDKKDKGDDE